MHNYFRSRYDKAANFMDSMMSRGFAGMVVDENIRDIRSISCHGSEELSIPPCESRVDSKNFDKSYYCGACNCGDHSHTQLIKIHVGHYSKLDYPRIICPLKMPGFNNYVPLTISENNPRKKLIEDIFGIDYLTDLTRKKENPSDK